MIGYVTLGTNDLDRALVFYDALIGLLGGRRLMELPDARGFTLYGVARDQPMLAITRPIDGGPASAGNGAMVALPVDSDALVDSLYAKAIELGASDEGAPGVRRAGRYAAYFRDADGNKFSIYHHSDG